MRTARRPMLIGAAAVAGVLVMLACFSEHEAVAPTEGQCSLPLDAAVPGSIVIAVRNFGFEPAELRIRAGQKVTWVNCETEVVGHTSTADAGAWTSPVLLPGQAFTRTFDQVGDFPYHCEPHPFMTGRVIVE